MSFSEIVRYLLVWGIVGAVLFSLFVIFVFKTGLVYTSRKEDGLLKDKIPLTGYLVSIGFLIIIIFYLVAANYFGLFQNGYQLGYWSLFALNLGLYLLLFMFDTLFIDGFVLGSMRPAFLELPEAMGEESMREHIKKSIPVGTLTGLVISLVCTSISYFLFG
jgi:hypothetical protein